jgi:hypothetical protein
VRSSSIASFASPSLIAGVRVESFGRAGAKTDGGESGAMPAQWTNLVSPTVRRHNFHKTCSGVMFGRSAGMTVGCEVADHAMLNTRAIAGHAVKTGDFSAVSPEATITGEASIGRGAPRRQALCQSTRTPGRRTR